MHFLDTADYECRILGLPKTIDNDLVYTDHCPGFGSAAKFVANTMTQIATDLEAYPTGKVTVVEVMGRNAGWLTAASCIANLAGCGPDLIYLPEIPFSIGKFKQDVAKVYEKNKRCLVAVSEGIRDSEGCVYGESPACKDSFGHAQLGGVATMLANVIKTDLGYPSRGIEFNVMQRASTYLLSKTDLEESIAIGRVGVQWILEGHTHLMICMKREPGPEYKISYFGQALQDIANGEQLIPRDWINVDGNGVTQGFFDYVRPLILGEVSPIYKNGIIEMFRL
jgi:6-phosphofructokinase 1